MGVGDVGSKHVGAHAEIPHFPTDTAPKAQAADFVSFTAGSELARHDQWKPGDQVTMEGHCRQAVTRFEEGYEQFKNDPKKLKAFMHAVEADLQKVSPEQRHNLGNAFQHIATHSMSRHDGVNEAFEKLAKHCGWVPTPDVHGHGEKAHDRKTDGLKEGRGGARDVQEGVAGAAYGVVYLIKRFNETNAFGQAVFDDKDLDKHLKAAIENYAHHPGQRGEFLRHLGRAVQGMELSQGAEATVFTLIGNSLRRIETEMGKPDKATQAFLREARAELRHDMKAPIVAEQHREKSVDDRTNGVIHAIAKGDGSAAARELGHALEECAGNPKSVLQFRKRIEMALMAPTDEAGVRKNIEAFMTALDTAEDKLDSKHKSARGMVDMISDLRTMINDLTPPN